MTRGLLGCSGLAATLLSSCGARPPEAPARSAVAVVEVPAARGSSDESSAPPSAVRVERKDPLDYFVGTWDGVFTDQRVPNGAWNTVLTIDGYGRFNVHVAPPQGPACDQSGSVRVAPQLMVLDTSRNTCNPDRRGPEERPIVSQEDDEFVLRTPDALMTFRYTRRGPETDEE
jgi:hypothetical protein